MSKKVLVLADSLALPRTTPEVCAYELTWPNLLRTIGYEVHQVAIGGATSTDLLKQVDYHKSFNPNIVVVQVGIVDCAPRFLTQLEVSLVRKMGVLGKGILKIANKNIVRKYRKICYVKPQTFKSNIEQIEKKLKASTVIFLAILPAAPEYQLLLPGIEKRIAQFNAILSQTRHFIPLDDFDMSGIMSDHHHLNEMGQEQIFKRVLAKINA